MTAPDIRFDARLQRILQVAVAGLPEEECAQRVAWCQETGQHGITMQPHQVGATFHWGGRLLVVVDYGVFADDAYLRDLDITMHPPADATSSEAL